MNKLTLNEPTTRLKTDITRIIVIPGSALQEKVFAGKRVVLLSLLRVNLQIPTWSRLRRLQQTDSFGMS